MRYISFSTWIYSVQQTLVSHGHTWLATPEWLHHTLVPRTKSADASLPTVRLWISNYAHINQWDAITHTWPNCNSLAKSALMVRHGWLITSQINGCNYICTSTCLIVCAVFVILLKFIWSRGSLFHVAAPDLTHQYGYTIHQFAVSPDIGVCLVRNDNIHTICNIRCQHDTQMMQYAGCSWTLHNLTLFLSDKPCEIQNDVAGDPI